MSVEALRELCAAMELLESADERQRASEAWGSGAWRLQDSADHECDALRKEAAAAAAKAIRELLATGELDDIAPI